MLRHYKDNSSRGRLPRTKSRGHESQVTSQFSFFTTKRNFRRPPLHRSAAPLPGRRTRIARSGTPRPRTGRAAGGNKQRAFSPARRASASPRGERDPHRRIADNGGSAGNHHRRSMVQASGRNAKTFPRSSGVAASNDGNRRPLQFATRTGETDLSRMRRSGRRNSGFLFGKSKPRRRTKTLSLSNTRSTFAADARISSHQEKKPVAVFSARIGHRGRSAAARNSRGGTRLGGKFDGDVL